jgi:hypothetical protein
MILDIFSTIKNFVVAIASGLGLLQDRNRAANAPEVVAAAKGATDQTVRDTVNQAVAEKDIDALRKLL